MRGDSSLMSLKVLDTTKSGELPAGFRSSGVAAPSEELGKMKDAPWDERSVPKHEYMQMGERSQWEFEQEYMDPSATVVTHLLDLPWDEFPMWRVGIELRRIIHAEVKHVHFSPDKVGRALQRRHRAE